MTCFRDGAGLREREAARFLEAGGAGVDSGNSSAGEELLGGEVAGSRRPL